MNTLTIAFLVVCAMAAYASALPAAVPDTVLSVVAPVELLEGAESKHGGGGGYHHKDYHHGGGGGHGGGNYHHGGGGGYHHGGGGYHHG